MSVLLVRIDDRLIHGQVSVGWATHLRPDLILVLDDEVAADNWENDLVCAACPDSVRARVMRIAEGSRFLSDEAPSADRIVVLLRGTKQARLMLDGGFRPQSINIGGLHHHEGSRSLLPFVYLDSSEVADLRYLADHGVGLSAQDLPGNRSVDLVPLLPDPVR
ncbi:MAG: PTS sugar transporter subunit IIB [Candidatus Eisenbacteria bacterium]|nr:PTS sugar transporter subunit IIB [Candidatus Eisenbacteria bacterium]